MGRRRGIVEPLLTVRIWGSTFVVTKSTLDQIGPLTLCVASLYPNLVPVVGVSLAHSSV